mgnify:CR=1 FL=1
MSDTVQMRLTVSRATSGTLHQVAVLTGLRVGVVASLLIESLTADANAGSLCDLVLAQRHSRVLRAHGQDTGAYRLTDHHV